MYKYCFFDLDGTITDPKVGITSAVAYALERYGIHVEDKDTLTPFIGPPLNESFMVYFGFSEPESFRAVDVYREYYRDRGIFECVLYPGMDTLLRRLRDAGVQVVMATSKPEVFARRLAEHFHIDDCFACITGSELNGDRVAKHEVIAAAMERMGMDSADGAVMIGDRMHDVHGARAHNMETVGVLYGYGSREEFVAAGADHIVATVAELEELLFCRGAAPNPAKKTCL